MPFLDMSEGGLHESEVIACDLQVESHFGGENSSVEGTLTLADGRRLQLSAQGSASDRGTFYKITEGDNKESNNFWWDQVEWLDSWITDHWPEQHDEFDDFRATLKFGPDQPSPTAMKKTTTPAPSCTCSSRVRPSCGILSGGTPTP